MIVLYMLIMNQRTNYHKYGINAIKSDILELWKEKKILNIFVAIPFILLILIPTIIIDLSNYIQSLL